MLITLVIISPVVILSPVHGFCTRPTPMCGGGGGSTYFTVEAVPSNLQVAGGSQSQSVGQTTWDRISLWTTSNVDGTTVWFPSSTVARFSNPQFSWPPAVSLVSKGQWTVGSKLVLVE